VVSEINPSLKIASCVLNAYPFLLKLSLARKNERKIIAPINAPIIIQTLFEKRSDLKKEIPKNSIKIKKLNRLKLIAITLKYLDCN
jgi:mannose/fructose-specific phosphotransferase system component IIA